MLSYIMFAAGGLLFCNVLFAIAKNGIFLKNLHLFFKNKKGAVAKLKDLMLLTNSTRGTAAEPGQGRERMGGQFAGYIPANRAERFREADRR